MGVKMTPSTRCQSLHSLSKSRVCGQRPWLPVGRGPGQKPNAAQQTALYPGLWGAPRVWGVCVLALLLLPGRAPGLEGKLALRLPAITPEVHQRVEIAVAGMPATTNPFDPQEITLDMTVTPPSGNVLDVPGFFSRDYERRLEENREVLSPQGDGGWRLRWLPLEPGAHKLIVTAAVEGQAFARGEAVVQVSAGKRHGIARVDPRERRYFRLDDGTPLFLNGLCACWYGERGTYDYDDWLEAYQKAGINYIRLWMCARRSGSSGTGATGPATASTPPGASTGSWRRPSAAASSSCSASTTTASSR